LGDYVIEKRRTQLLSLAIGVSIAILALLQAIIWPKSDAILFAPGGFVFILFQGGVHSSGFGAIFVVGTIFNCLIYASIAWVGLMLYHKVKSHA
jgi:hypothetical protein